MKKVWLAVIALLSMSALAAAIEPKDAPKVIKVLGTASARVPADGLRIAFTFPANKGRFVDAEALSKGIQAEMKPKLKDADKIQIKATVGWDVIRQTKIAIGDKGRKVDVNVIYELENIPEGALFDTLSLAVDGALRANEEIRLQKVESYISSAKEQQLMASLHKQAAADAYQKAQQAADGGKALLGSLRELDAIGEHARMNVSIRQSMSRSQNYLSEDESMFRKSFNVNSEVDDQKDVELIIAAVYEVK